MLLRLKFETKVWSQTKVLVNDTIASFNNSQREKSHTVHQYICSKDDKNHQKMEIFNVDQSMSEDMWT